MAFIRNGLARNSAGAGIGNTIWNYSSPDSYATVSGASYFDPANKELTFSDVMYVWDSTLEVLTLTYVTQSGPGEVVTIATGLTVPA